MKINILLALFAGMFSSLVLFGCEEKESDSSVVEEAEEAEE